MHAQRSPFLIAIEGAFGPVPVENNILQVLSVMEAVDPLHVQVRQRITILKQNQCVGIEPHICEGEAVCA